MYSLRVNGRLLAESDRVVVCAGADNGMRTCGCVGSTRRNDVKAGADSAVVDESVLDGRTSRLAADVKPRTVDVMVMESDALCL